MQRFLPFLQWLPKYKKKDFPKDLFAGLTVGIVLIPQGMAYAMIAGLPPVYGLYASLFPVLVYVFLGTSRQLAIGPVAMDSLLVAAGLATLAISSVQDYIAMAILLAFMVGVIQLILGLFRMGFLVNFLSKPVISGFTSAAAVIIIFSQLKHLLGTEIEGSNQFHILAMSAFQVIGNTNPIDFFFGIFGIVAIIALGKWKPRIPSILLVVLLGILATSFFNLEGLGLKIVGEIPSGLPAFNIPDITLDNALALWPIALTLALIGYMEAISIAKSLKSEDEPHNLDANQELVAIGTSNIVGSFFQSYPITGGFSRSAINKSAGARTNLAALFAVVMVVVVLLFLTPLFYFLPKAILASIIMVAVFGLIDLEYPRKLWNQRKDEFVVLAITFLVTLFIGITEGILMGVLSSLLLLVYRTSMPHFAILAKLQDSEYYKNVNRFGDEVEDRPDLLIVRFDSQLYFGNSNYFRKQLFKFIDAKGEALKGVILNAEAINYIDSTAAQMLVNVIRKIHERDLKFYMVGAIGPIRDIIFASDIIRELDKQYHFAEVKEAVSFFDDPESVSPVGSKIAYQNRANGR